MAGLGLKGCLSQVHWAKDNLDGYMNFYSCSGDGRVTNWTIVKTSLWYSDLLQVSFTKQLKNYKNDISMTDGVRTFAFKPDDDALYLIGTEVLHVIFCGSQRFNEEIDQRSIE